MGICIIHEVIQLLIQIVKLHGQIIEYKYFRDAKGWEKKGPVRKICGKVSEFDGRIVLVKNNPDISIFPNYHVTYLKILSSIPTTCAQIYLQNHISL